MRPDEPARAANHFHLALLRQRRKSAGELGDDLVLPFAQLARIDLRFAEVQARAAHRLGVLDHPGSMQQRFRRNTTDVEAHPAELRPSFDESDTHAEIGSAERCGVAAGTGAQDYDV